MFRNTGLQHNNVPTNTVPTIEFCGKVTAAQLNRLSTTEPPAGFSGYPGSALIAPATFFRPFLENLDRSNLSFSHAPASNA